MFGLFHLFIFLMSWCTYICILVTVTCVQVFCTLPVCNDDYVIWTQGLL